MENCTLHIHQFRVELASFQHFSMVPNKEIHPFEIVFRIVKGYLEARKLCLTAYTVADLTTSQFHSQFKLTTEFTDYFTSLLVNNRKDPILN